METGDFSRLKDLEQPTDSDPMYGTVLWSTIGVGAARTGNTKLAEQAEQALAQLRDVRAKLPGASSDNFPEANRLMVAAWLAHQAGNRDQAQTLLRQAADLQEKIGATYSTFKPIREYLADMLMIDGKKKEALAEYEAVLKPLPHRFNSVYGAGTAAFDTGDVQTAKKYYNELTQFAHGDERPELATARKRMDSEVAAK
jgi:tetratricopeptide (TPR) repeat protein